MPESRFVLKILTLALALVLSAPVLAADKWSRFNSDEGRFSVMVPAPPQHQTSTNQTPVGPVVENSFVSVKQGGNYTVSFTDLPGVALMFEGRDGIYDEARAALLKQVGGRQVSFLPVKVAGREARALNYKVGANAQALAGRAWFLLVGRRLYVIDATLPTAKAPKGFDPFFASLEVTGD